MAAVEVRERTSPGVNGHAPDPRALAVVGVLQGRLPDTKEIVLFGSRAMGNWRPWSDLDLAVSGVPADRASEDSLHQQAVAIARDQYGRESPSVQIFPFPRSEFEACRTSHSHIAGQVQYWGIAATGNPLPHMTQDNPWPAVQVHLQSAHNDLGNALFNLNGGPPQFAVALRSAHGALENCFKALLSAAKVKFLHIHKLEELAPQMPYVHGAQAGDFPDTEWLKALTRFGEQSPYVGANPPWPEESPRSVVDRAQYLCGGLAQATLDLMHKHPTDVGYEPCMTGTLPWGALSPCLLTISRQVNAWSGSVPPRCWKVQPQTPWNTWKKSRCKAASDCGMHGWKLVKPRILTR